MKKRKFLAVPAAMIIALGTVGVGFQGVAQAGEPSQPRNVTATPGDNLLLVQWSAPLDDGGSDIIGYTAIANGSSDDSCVTGPSTPPAAPATQCTIAGLTNGVAYEVTVTATNADDSVSIPSGPSAPVIPFSLPAKPAKPTPVTAGNASVTVTIPAYNDDTGGFPILDFTVTSTPGGQTCTVAAPASPAAVSCVVSNLTNNTPYTFTAVARTAKGTSTSSVPSDVVTPANTAPTPPTGVEVTAGNNQATVQWQAPSSSGATPISSYDVMWDTVPASGTWKNASAPCYHDTASPCVLAASSGPFTVGQRYIFAVIANNTDDSSVPSATAGPITWIAAPGAPTLLTATPGNAQVALNWTAPTDDSGSAVSAYQFAFADDSPTFGNWSAWQTIPGGPVTNFTVTNLTNNKAYKFKVRAANGAGPGPEVVQTGSVTPIGTLPSSPIVSPTPGDQQVTLVVTAQSSGTTRANVSWTPGPGAQNQVCTGSASPYTCVVTGLSNGVTYTFSATVTNTSGTSLPSSASSTPRKVPSAPRTVTAIAGAGAATLSWLAPADNGGSAITGYQVQYSTDGGTTWLPSTPTSTNSTATSFTYTGLSATATVFRVRAVNAAVTADNPAPWSAASNSVTPTAGPPGAPTGVSGTAGNAQVALTWNVPGNGGSAITGYQVRFSSNSGSSWSSVISTNSTSASYTVTGLTNGTAYIFQVRAVNAINSGDWSASSASVTPNGAVPGAPRSVTAVAGNGQATVSWTAPADPGSSNITGYTVTSASALLGTPVRQCTTAGATSCTVTGLVNGVTYTFTVTATNAAGTGAPSVASNAVTPGAVPGAPTSVVATAGDARATVAWTAPASPGSSAITGYTVTSQSSLVGTPVRQCTTTGATTCTVTGLVNDVTYTFTVTATNAAGTGPASAVSNAVTPRGAVMTSIVIVGERGTGENENRVYVEGITEGLVGVKLTPYFRFPGQVGFTAGTGTRTVDANGDFSWQRKTGKRIVVEFRGGGETSNRVIIAAR